MRDPLFIRQYHIWHRILEEKTLCGIQRADIEGDPQKFIGFLTGVRPGDVTCKTCLRIAKRMAEGKRS